MTEPASKVSRNQILEGDREAYEALLYELQPAELAVSQSCNFSSGFALEGCRVLEYPIEVNFGANRRRFYVRSHARRILITRQRQNKTDNLRIR